MLPLTPGVSRNVFRENDPKSAAADAEYQAKRPRVLQAHQNTCQYCGVKSVEGIEVHHQDCNHANNSENNLKPGCVFCHPVNHIGELAARFTRADQSEIAGRYVGLSYIPDISQADLSHLLRTIGHVLLHGDEEQKFEAGALYDHLLTYSGYIEASWGSSKASHFAIALREASTPVYEARATSMSGIRIIFSLDAIKKLASRFAQEFSRMSMSTWDNVMKHRYTERNKGQ